MAKRASSSEAVTWADLWETLAGLAADRPLYEAGLRFAEVTDQVQGQLFDQHPMVALRLSRVVELRFTSLGLVAYLRTGIPAGRDSATPDAGPLLVGLQRFDPRTGEYDFIRYARIKRAPAWRQDLKRCLREILDELEAGAAADPRREVCCLAELMTPKHDDRPARWTEVEGGQVAVAEMGHWGDLQAAGISLPVWLSVVTSLGLVLAILSAR